MGDADDLRGSIGHALRQRPYLTARELVRALKALGHDTDRGRVNSFLYRHPELFHRDDDVPPKWSLAQATPMEARRTPHRVRGVQLRNWKAFEDVTAQVAGVTLFYGENSTGKSSLFQALRLMKQSWGHGELQFEGGLASFGWYQHVVHQHDVGRAVSLAAFWGESGSTNQWGLILEVPPGDRDFAYDPEHPIGRIMCLSPDGDVALVRPTDASKWSQLTGRDDVWLAVRLSQEHLGSPPDSILHQRLALGSDDHGFPDVDQVVGGAVATNATYRRTRAETLETIRGVLVGAGAMLDAIEHIGPVRTVPQRDISPNPPTS